MKIPLSILRPFQPIFCVLLAFTAIASAQAPADVDPANQFYELTKAAPRAFSSGETEKAAQMAEALLQEAENWKENWNYGNAVHAGNIVLGRIALAEGETAKAKRYLFAAGRTPGSPQLNSFGPDMTLAKEFLAKGEKDAVLQYFELCSKFWRKLHQDKLDAWTAAVKKGETPAFGANLKYFGF